MKWILLPFVILYRIYFAVVFFTVLLLLYPIFFLLLQKKSWFPAVFRLKVFTARIILFLDFIYLHRMGDFPKLENKTYVICSNHSSYLDIILMYLILPRNRFLFIGKSELLKWPIINIFFKKIDIAVDRTKKTSGMRSIIRAKEELDNGWSIVIFPEGGIPVDTPALNTFKNGAFKLAIDTETPILPITVLDNWKLFDTSSLFTGKARPGIARVVVHDPIHTQGMDKKDLIPLRNQVFDTINTPLLENKKVKK